MQKRNERCADRVISHKLKKTRLVFNMLSDFKTKNKEDELLLKHKQKWYATHQTQLRKCKAGL